MAAPKASDGAWLFAQECRFVAGTETLDRLPPPGLPEVAFAGRSNVGKSSLLNALTGRKHLARVSNTPGWTKLVDSYIRGRPNLCRILLLVDANVGTKDADETLMDLMDESGLSYQIVMTKADRLKPASLEKMRAKLAAQVPKRPACHPEIPATSADAGTGIAELRQALAAFTA